MVTTGIVGSSMPIANGLGWAAQLDGSRRVTVAYFGDGASNIGAFHESLNLASVWKLPVIFVCQNNGFAEHTRYENGTVGAIASPSARSPTACPASRLTATIPSPCMPLLTPPSAVPAPAKGRPCSSAGLSASMGHVFGDDDKYMTKEEKAAALAKDPLPRFRARLIADGIATEAQLAGTAAEDRSRGPGCHRLRHVL